MSCRHSLSTREPLRDRVTPKTLENLKRMFVGKKSFCPVIPSSGGRMLFPSFFWSRRTTTKRYLDHHHHLMMSVYFSWSALFLNRLYP